MLTQSFQFLDRVSHKKEASFYDQGINHWDDFISSTQIHGISLRSKSYYDRKLREAKQALHKGNSSYFHSLPTNQTWRLFPHFQEETVYLDIETTGLDRHAQITVIGLYDGLNTKSMIKGINLDYPTLKRELQKYKLIITFNGASFDLPFIRKRCDILPDIPHIDLRHCCAQIGLVGGLKHIEYELGIRRSKIVEKLYGGDALTLWRMYKATGDDHYLNLLVEYNEEDIINLKKIMKHCYGKLSNQRAYS